MCYYGKHGEEKIEQKAKKDIKAFKVLNAIIATNGSGRVVGYESPFRRERYRIGETKSVDGFGLEYMYGRNWVVIGEGLHAYSNEEKAFIERNSFCGSVVVALFVIPKGAKYYVNKHKEIVANKMKFAKVLKSIRP